MKKLTKYRDYCHQCGKGTDNAIVVVKHLAHSTVQYTFCCEACANHFYLRKLREGL